MTHQISQKLIQRNKIQLLEEKRRLEALLSRITQKRGKHDQGPLRPRYPEFGSKEDENAAEVALYEANIAEGADLEIKLRKVEGALKRIEDGTYGACLIGREKMSEQRLLAVPEAENCIAHEPKK